MDLTTHTSLSPIRRGFAPGFVSNKKGCTRLAAASDKVYQLLAHGRWFSPGIPASSTTKTGRHKKRKHYNNGQRNTTQKNKYIVTRTPLKTEDDVICSELIKVKNENNKKEEH
jgi:hypothetical protein